MIDPDIATAGYNLREICKQLILLEDHLAHENKQCPDCIAKHSLMVEALAQEGMALSPDKVEYAGLKLTEQAMSDATIAIKRGDYQWAQAILRATRKSLMQYAW